MTAIDCRLTGQATEGYIYISPTDLVGPGFRRHTFNPALLVLQQLVVLAELAQLRAQAAVLAAEGGQLAAEVRLQLPAGLQVRTPRRLLDVNHLF